MYSFCDLLGISKTDKQRCLRHSDLERFCLLKKDMHFFADNSIDIAEGVDEHQPRLSRKSKEGVRHEYADCTVAANILVLTGS